MDVCKTSSADGYVVYGCFNERRYTRLSTKPALQNVTALAQSVLWSNLLSATSLYDVTITIIVSFNSIINQRKRHLHITLNTTIGARHERSGPLSSHE